MSTQVQLKATYTNFHSTSDSSLSTRPFELSTPLPLPQDPNSTEQKTAYLRSLRDAVSDLQARVNGELTGRMEDEANRAAGNKGVNGTDEAAEEENYGEEVVEEDE